MPGEAYHADVVGEVLASELGSEADLLGLLEEFLLEVDVAECTAGLISSGGEAVVVFDTGEFHREEVLLCGSAADNECDVVRWTGRCAECAHLLYQERQQGALVLDGGLGHRIEVGLVGAAAALRNHHEAVLVALRGLDVDLGGEVAAGVHLVVHVQRSVLAVAEILLRVGVEHSPAQGFLVLKIGPDALAFFAVDDGCAGVLAEGQHALHSALRIAQELQGHVFIVLAGFRVVQDRSHLLVVGAAEHELAVVEALLCYQREGLWRYLQDSFASTSAHPTQFGGLNEFLGTGNLVVLSLVFAKLEHWRILEIHILFLH